jgi:hypothetical protein
VASERRPLSSLVYGGRRLAAGWTSADAPALQLGGRCVDSLLSAAEYDCSRPEGDPEPVVVVGGRPTAVGGSDAARRVLIRSATQDEVRGLQRYVLHSHECIAGGRFGAQPQSLATAIPHSGRHLQRTSRVHLPARFNACNAISKRRGLTALVIDCGSHAGGIPRVWKRTAAP